jgi:ABC-2 type transport system permease protein
VTAATAPAVPAGADRSAADRQVVRTLVSLKVRLLRNGIRRSGGRAAAYVLGAALGLLLAAGAAAGIAALHGHAGAGDAALTVTAALTLVWAALPLFLFATDESADPTRLAMLPLRPSPLLRGMVLAALIGPGPVTALLLLTGVAVAAADGAASAVVAVLAVPLGVVTLVALCRTVAVANARLLGSRRGRDLAVFGGLLFALLFQCANILFQTALHRQGKVDLQSLAPLAHVVRWIPPVSALGAVQSAGEGSWAAVAVQLAGTAALLALLLRWWLACLVRLMVTADSSTIGAAPTRTVSSGDGADRWARLLPPGRAGAAMQRQLRYTWREPRAKVGVATALGMTVVFVLLSAAQGHATVYAAVSGGLLLGMQMLNLFGMDGSAFWLIALTLGTRADARAELRGRALAAASYGVPFTVLLTVVAAALSGQWAQLAETLGLTWALLGCGMAVGPLASVLVPYAMPEGGNPMQNAAPGQAGLVLGAVFGSIFAVVGLCLPVGAAAVLLHIADGPTWVLLPLGALYGLGAAAVGIRLAARLLMRRLPETLAAVIER